MKLKCAESSQIPSLIHTGQWIRPYLSLLLYSQRMRQLIQSIRKIQYLVLLNNSSHVLLHSNEQCAIWIAIRTVLRDGAHLCIPALSSGGLQYCRGRSITKTSSQSPRPSASGKGNTCLCYHLRGQKERAMGWHSFWIANVKKVSSLLAQEQSNRSLRSGLTTQDPVHAFLSETRRAEAVSSGNENGAWIVPYYWVELGCFY